MKFRLVSSTSYGSNGFFTITDLFFLIKLIYFYEKCFKNFQVLENSFGSILTFFELSSINLDLCVITMKFFQKYYWLFSAHKFLWDSSVLSLDEQVWNNIKINISKYYTFFNSKRSLVIFKCHLFFMGNFFYRHF